MRILPICAHSPPHNWQLFRYMRQCMCAADKNSYSGEDTVLMAITVDAFVQVQRLCRIALTYLFIYSFNTGSTVMQGMA